jgi:segregation and condensation protein B
MDDSPALDVERICAVIESMLLVSSEPLPVDRVREIVIAEAPATDPGAVDLAVEALLSRYADPERPFGRGIRLDMVADGLQLRTPADSAPYLRRLLAARPPKLTKPAMETLAVIAYRQPVTKPEIESIRGVDVGAVLKALLDRDLIRIIGKSEDLGRPILYGTTKKFLELFGLRSLGALPTLREYHELDEVHQQHVDELYEDSRPRISDLAAKAAFLVERTHDADLDALASAEASAEAAGPAHGGRAARRRRGAHRPTPAVRGGPHARAHRGRGRGDAARASAAWPRRGRSATRDGGRHDRRSHDRDLHERRG